LLKNNAFPEEGEIKGLFEKNVFGIFSKEENKFLKGS
jgi:hypothetical protein